MPPPPEPVFPGLLPPQSKINSARRSLARSVAAAVRSATHARDVALGGLAAADEAAAAPHCADALQARADRAAAAARVRDADLADLMAAYAQAAATGAQPSASRCPPTLGTWTAPSCTTTTRS